MTHKLFPNPVKNIIDLSSDKDGEKASEDKSPALSCKKRKVVHLKLRIEELQSIGTLVLKQLKGKIMILRGQINSVKAELGLMGVKMRKLVRWFDDIKATLSM